MAAAADNDAAMDATTASEGGLRQGEHNRSDWVLWSVSGGGGGGVCPVQALLVAVHAEATSEMQESIKGGESAMTRLASQYADYQHQCVVAVLSRRPQLQVERKALSAIILHDGKARDIVNDLLGREVVSEKDFGWNVKAKQVN